MDSARHASSPQHSATVMASAGTGKTWLLVTRLVRLLLEGTDPGAILAITFTRKAAAEMAARLTDRLHELAYQDDDARGRTLEAMGIASTAALRHAAAGLYEKHLFAPRQMRVTTFHAFCQEMLRRFPLEADVPAGFEVLDGSGQFQEAAWDALVNEATRAPDSPVAQALDTMFRCFNGHQNTQAALMRFLHHRSDWWAYTHGEDDPLRHAVERLTAQLNIGADDDPMADFFCGETRAQLREFATLLALHPTQTNLEHAAHVSDALNPQRAPEERLVAIKTAFLTQNGDPLKSRKPSQAAAKAMGEAKQQRFLDLHALICDKLARLQDSLRKVATLALSQAWYRAGSQLLSHYQRLKTEQRQLDFSDLEWKAFLLLNHADQALWVQYKLDQRIDHLLIDEFQDTNPTQWHLIFPLLQELAAGKGERERTVFLVGDAKQSIYRFRRAEPDLFATAQQWLRDRLHAIDHTLTASWRSAPAVIDFVNRVFAADALRGHLPEFQPHTTHRGALWGRVEVLPLTAADETETPATAELRNPLQHPRIFLKDQRHRREGEMIAARIRSLLSDRAAAGQGNEARPLRYDDIMILVRNRTHVRAYEEALRAAHIPYATASRGTLLDCIEIRDMVALLEILIVPYNNLTLAVVLRSPLFDCDDQELMQLAAQPGGNWLERLLTLAPRLAAGSPLARAAHWLPRWRAAAGQQPVHDLLDRIYSEGNVMARYESAFPAHLRLRVRANLTRFIELALEMDSGRYPSLTSFLHRLDTLRASEEDAPDEATESTAAGSVRLLTIHAAKGLEAPVVFLADAAAGVGRGNRAFQSVVQWPAHDERPSHFLLCGKSSAADSVTAALLAQEARQEQRERANLLYVALTRAKQLLFISGSKPKRYDDLGWYGAIAAQLGDVDTICREGWIASSGEPVPPMAHLATTSAETMVDSELALPLAIAPAEEEIAPSRGIVKGDGVIAGDEEGRERGLAIHRFLQLLTGGENPDAALLRRVSAEFDLDELSQAPQEWLAEAERLIKEPALRAWFDPNCYDSAFNEMPIYYLDGERLVHGVVDRLVIRGNDCTLIDYKTHRNAVAERLAALAAPYDEQLRLYVEGIKRLWPEKTIRAYLLFTRCASVYQWQTGSATCD